MGQAFAEEIIRKHIERYGGHVELGKELLGFEQSDDGVSVQIRDVSEGTIENFKGSYVVGADGARGVQINFIESILMSMPL